MLCKAVHFKVYMHWACDAGSRLMFKFKSGTHGLNQELEEGRGERSSYYVHNDECEGVSHVLWDCPVYSTIKNDFMCKLQELLGIDLNVMRAWIVLKMHLLFGY